MNQVKNLHKLTLQPGSLAIMIKLGCLKFVFGGCVLTLQLPEVTNIKLLPTKSIHSSANRRQEYSNLSGRSCYLDLTPSSHN